MAWTNNIDWLDGETITELKLDQLTQNVEYVKAYSVPSGGIIMWAGTEAQIPSGWYLCNGNNGTPNLVNRFIICAGDSYTPPTWDDVNKVVTSPGQTGGVNTHTHDLQNHIHVVNAVNIDHTHSMQSHTHAHSHTHLVSGYTGYYNLTTDNVADGSGDDVASDDNVNHRHSVSITSQGPSVASTDGPSVASTGAMSANASHGHGNTGTPSVNSTGSGSNVPVFYALCYIMKG